MERSSSGSVVRECSPSSAFPELPEAKDWDEGDCAPNKNDVIFEARDEEPSTDCRGDEAPEDENADARDFTRFRDPAAAWNIMAGHIVSRIC